MLREDLIFQRIATIPSRIFVSNGVEFDRSSFRRPTGRGLLSSGRFHHGVLAILRGSKEAFSSHNSPTRVILSNTPSRATKVNPSPRPFMCALYFLLNDVGISQ